MSHGKEAARDLRYGRRGGGWAHHDAEQVEKALASLHATRMSSIRHDLAHPDDAADPRKRKWPLESLDLWRQVAEQPEHPSYLRALEVVEELAHAR